MSEDPRAPRDEKFELGFDPAAEDTENVRLWHPTHAAHEGSADIPEDG